MQVKTFSFTKVNVMSQHSYNTCIPDLFGQSDWQVLQLYHTSWYTRRCRVNKVKKHVCCTFNPSSPVVTRSQLVTRYHSLSAVISFITRRHYHCISFYMSSVYPKFQASILVNKKVFKRWAFGPPQGPFRGP